MKKFIHKFGFLFLLMAAFPVGFFGSKFFCTIIEADSYDIIYCANPENVAVGIECPSGGSGSGVIFKNKNRTYIWTVAHVVSSTQKIKTVISNETKLPAVSVTYDDVWVVEEVVQNGRKVGENKRLAKVIRYGKNDDLALLMVYEENTFKNSTRFDFNIPQLGVDIRHVGCFHGRLGHNSISDGQIASVGRLRIGFVSNEIGNPIIYDQVSGVFHHGSSGGGVFLKNNNKCIGLLTEFLNVNVSSDGSRLFTHGSGCITPSRRMKEFAERTSCEWALEENFKSPSLAEIMSGKVTDTEVDVPPDFPVKK